MAMMPDYDRLERSQKRQQELELKLILTMGKVQALFRKDTETADTLQKLIDRIGK